MTQLLSIRARILILITGGIVVVWLAATALSYRDARRELNALFDAQLAESGRVLLMQASHELDEAGEHGRRARAIDIDVEHPYAQELHLQLWDREGRLVYQSTDDLPSERLVTGMTNGYADRTLHGGRWRVLVLTDAGSGLQIQVCQSYEGRTRLAASVARNMLLPLIVALPLIAGLIWIATTRAIRPLADLAGALESRDSEDMTPLRAGAMPRELEPVSRSVDGLLARLRDRFELERRFTADAAHELRTPLAAIKTQAQVASGAATDAERAHAVAQIVRGVDRATHLVEQLLTLARLDPEASVSVEEPVDLGRIARETVAAFGAGGAAVRVEAPAAMVRGHAALLATLTRNLVENAIVHGNGENVEVRVEAGNDVVLHVEDRGPGITQAERERVFDRFYRAPGGRPGSGLGLSIVRRIAELHGATVRLESSDDGRGLHVTVRLPAAQRDASPR